MALLVDQLIHHNTPPCTPGAVCSIRPWFFLLLQCTHRARQENQPRCQDQLSSLAFATPAKLRQRFEAQLVVPALVAEVLRVHLGGPVEVLWMIARPRLTQNTSQWIRVLRVSSGYITGYTQVRNNSSLGLFFNRGFECHCATHHGVPVIVSSQYHWQQL